MPKENAKKTAGIAICVIIALIAASNPFRLAFSLPDSVTLMTGQEFTVDTGYPVVSVGPLGRGRTSPWSRFDLSTKVTMDTYSPGEYAIEFKLFGLIPLRRVSLTVAEPVMVVPGGHSIGVILRASGLVVTGLSPVTTPGGKETWPAKNAGIEAGDVVLSVNDSRVGSKADLALAVDRAGKKGLSVDLLIEKGDGSVIHRSLRPVENRDGGYNIGIFVKDSLAGVGTLTFYDSATGLYAALGHVISEGDSHRPVSMKKGQIVKATVTGIQPSKKGQPGEVLGTFVEGRDVIGSIIKNGDCGITGILHVLPENSFFETAVPLGLESQLHKGPAEMLTTLSGTNIERFSIEIEQIFGGSRASSKGFVIRITDPALLNATGGIIQGMSGSPILQDGRLVGAVTHVLVNDPSRGYGTFAEWMAKEARMISPSTSSVGIPAFKGVE